MHTDEAVNAYIIGQLLAGRPFIYDSQDRHGPALAAIARLFELGREKILTSKGGRRFALTALKFFLGAGVPFLIAAALSVSALIASASRGGFLSTASALAVIGSLVGSLALSPAAGGSVAPVILPALPHGTTRLATVRHTVTGYAWPGRHAVATVPATWYGYQSVLPVVAMTLGWVRVRLAQRPDGSMAWIPAADVTFGSTPYAIVIDSRTMHLALYDQAMWDKNQLTKLAGEKFKTNTLIEDRKAESADPANFEDPAGAFSPADNSIPALMRRPAWAISLSAFGLLMECESLRPTRPLETCQ